ncbi:MAG: gfo/Idh/MocA family oxidoreductase [Actinomyces sp.]|nr:MAG: gfo/Idh/MocA family oxidoreductase [Actinomyces sp.]
MSATASEIRYGIIGTGMMGVEHIENIAHLDGATVTAVADPHPPSLEAARRAVGHEVAAFADHRDLLASGTCDAVVIASPNHTHVDILDDVLATELHVLVEKPLCTTVADCRRVVEAARDRRGVVWMGLEYRYMAPVARLVEEVRAGTVGRLRMLAIREHRFPFLVKVGDWNRFSINTGGTLVEKCCHFFDLMNLITGERPVRVLASGGQDVNHLDEEYGGRRPDILDNAYVIVEYPGVRAMLDLCMFAEATRNQEELVAVGDDGKVEALVPDDVVRIGRRGEHTIGSVEEHPVRDDRVRYAGYHHGSSYLEHVGFRDAIRNGTPPEVTLEDGLWSVAVGVAAHRSIDEGRPVTLDEVLSDPAA